MIKTLRKIVVAPNSFKESLTSTEVAYAIAKGIREVSQDIEVDICPLADGGDGTIDAYCNAADAHIRTMKVTGPLDEEAIARYALSNDRSIAVVEMSQIAGLHLVPQDKRNPLVTSTYGVGEIISRLIKKGVTHIILGIGGSATVDGGIGMAAALGYKFYNKEMKPIELTGGGLADLHLIVPPIKPIFDNCTITVASDVTNPLLGKNGAAHIYAPQKGATPEMVEILENNLSLLAQISKRDLGVDFKNYKGAGAAGGLGFGAMTFLDAKLESGSSLILNLAHFEERIKDAQLIITGEGKIDGQSAYGKVLSGVGAIAQKNNIPVIALCGIIGDDAQKLHKYGISSIFSINDKPMLLEEAIHSTQKNLVKISSEIFRLLTMGR